MAYITQLKKQKSKGAICSTSL